ncbi:MAG TPA: four helix bundle protein [Gemmatimonadales bacterium]|jgi:four helix bundle protein|nr:four helix bundle protein [Gemmatimonadales bacterium]
MKKYEKLLAWQRARELVLAVYHATADWPSAERYGLTSQLRRASVSVAANIAEGSAKQGPREFRRFLDIAIGSLAEVGCLLTLARDLALLTDETWAVIDGKRDSAAALTWLLFNSLSR